MNKIVFIAKIMLFSLRRFFLFQKNIFKELANYCNRYWNVQFNEVKYISLQYRIFVIYNYFKIIYFKPEMPFIDVKNIVPRRVQSELLPIINLCKDVMVDKILFYRTLQKYRVPYPDVLFYKKEGICYLLDGTEAHNYKSSTIDNVFAKKYDGSAGDGSFVVENEKVENLPSGFLYQSIEKNHPEIYLLAENKVLNTIRVHSYLCDDNSVELQSAHIKLSNGNITDNIGTGGIGVAIDINSGKLYENGFAEIGKQQTFKRHPLGKIDLENFSIPFWDLTIKLIHQLHHIFRNDVRSVGWDIAITENGPSVIEGNAGGDIFIPQVFIKPYYNTRMIQENIIAKNDY